jgi:hypothetical protein
MAKSLARETPGASPTSRRWFTSCSLSSTEGLRWIGAAPRPITDKLEIARRCRYQKIGAPPLTTGSFRNIASRTKPSGQGNDFDWRKADSLSSAIQVCPIQETRLNSASLQQTQKTPRIAMGWERTLIHAHKPMCVEIKVVTREIMLFRGI